MSTILILGAGEVGAAAAHFAAAVPAVSHVIVADRDPVAATRVAAEAGSKATARVLDARDASALAEALRGADAVLNFVGPYYRFARPVLEAAIAAGVHYLDVCDDWEPTLELLSLAPQARERGVCALVGIGASPGVTNVLAALAMREMPDAQELITAWRGDDVGEGYSAAKEHWLHQCSGAIRVLRDGRLVDETPLGELRVDYPGVGEIPLTVLGHPEPVTLARRYPTLRASFNAMAVPPGLLTLLQQVCREIDGGHLTLRSAAETFGARYAMAGADDLSVVQALPGLFAVARRRDGARWTSVVVTNHRYAGPGLGPVTAGPTIAALRLMLEGRLRAAGVHTPEEALAPEEFLDAYAAVFGATPPIWRVERV